MRSTQPVAPSAPSAAASARTPRVPTSDPPRIATWFPLLLALTAAAATLLLFADYQQSLEPVPVTVSDGDQSRVVPAADPGPLALLLGAGAVLAVVLGPLVAMLVAVWSGTWAWLSWDALRGRDKVLLLAATAVALAVAAFTVSPVGQDVSRWYFD